MNELIAWLETWKVTHSMQMSSFLFSHCWSSVFHLIFPCTLSSRLTSFSLMCFTHSDLPHLPLPPPLLSFHCSPSSHHLLFPCTLSVLGISDSFLWLFCVKGRDWIFLGIVLPTTSGPTHSLARDTGVTSRRSPLAALSGEKLSCHQMPLLASQKRKSTVLIPVWISLHFKLLPEIVFMFFMFFILPHHWG